MKFPKIKSVKVISNYQLEITFENNLKKMYDRKPLLTNQNIKPLLSKYLFEHVKVDHSGYAIV